MQANLRTIAVSVFMMSAGLVYGCSADDGTDGHGVGGAEHSAGAAGKGGSTASGGTATQNSGGVTHAGAAGKSVTSAVSTGGFASGGMASGGTSTGGSAKGGTGPSSGGTTSTSAGTSGVSAGNAGRSSVSGAGGSAPSGGTGGTFGIAGSGTSGGGVAGSGGSWARAGSAGAAGASTRTIQSLIVTERGQNCYTCLTQYCGADMDINPVGFDVMGQEGCDTLAGVAAVGSPAAGEPLRELCNDTLQCILQTDCVANNSVQPCYCGTSGTQCTTPGAANGVCLAPEQRGLGSTDATFAATNFTNLDLATGRANLLAQCMIYAALEDPTNCGSCL